MIDSFVSILRHLEKMHDPWLSPRIAQKICYLTVIAVLVLELSHWKDGSTLISKTKDKTVILILAGALIPCLLCVSISLFVYHSISSSAFKTLEIWKKNMTPNYLSNQGALAICCRVLFKNPLDRNPKRMICKVIFFFQIEKTLPAPAPKKDEKDHN